jgi:hypothetical protein
MVGKGGSVKDWWEKREVLRMVGKGGSVKDGGKRGKC